MKQRRKGQFDMIQQGEDQKITSAWSAHIAKQSKDGLGAQMFRVPFEAACL
jgi:hypothetical protein